jgi:hypothetical protein
LPLKRQPFFITILNKKEYDEKNNFCSIGFNAFGGGFGM